MTSIGGPLRDDEQSLHQAVSVGTRRVLRPAVHGVAEDRQQHLRGHRRGRCLGLLVEPSDGWIQNLDRHVRGSPRHPAARARRRALASLFNALVTRFWFFVALAGRALSSYDFGDGPPGAIRLFVMVGTPSCWYVPTLRPSGMVDATGSPL
jgi:hypothetical protein